MQPGPREVTHLSKVAQFLSGRLLLPAFIWHTHNLPPYLTDPEVTSVDITVPVLQREKWGPEREWLMQGSCWKV